MRDPLVGALLRSAEPSIRWKVRVGVLGDDRRSKAMRALGEEIRRSPRVRALLSRRAQLGRAGTARQVYYKWQGLHWVLAALADLGYPEGDETLVPIRDRVVGFWTGPTYFHEFEAATSASSYGKRGVPIISGRHRRCGSQQGNALRSVIALGIAGEGADVLVERLLHWQWPDGGWNCDRNPGAHVSSFNETLLPLRGLAAYARARRRPAMKKAIDRAAEVFLGRRLFKRLRDGRVMTPDFIALHYPHYWHYDVLAGLTAMVEIGKIRDPRCADALDLLESKRLADGGWPAERRYYTVSRATAMRSNADSVAWGVTSRSRMNEWVTAEALTVLRAAGRLRP
ncbi:MAG TPA: hypothetical protein VLI88_02150 [Patescibacteria group bacterium]|nr:hypothetical protein [Patescibacteria group bacterium]